MRVYGNAPGYCLYQLSGLQEGHKKFLISETGKKSKELVYEKGCGTKFDECFA